MAFFLGVMYLIQDRYLKKRKVQGLYYLLPSLELIDELSLQVLELRFSAPHAWYHYRGHLVAALAWHLLDVEAQANLVSYNVVSLRGTPARKAHLGAGAGGRRHCFQSLPS